MSTAHASLKPSKRPHAYISFSLNLKIMNINNSCKFYSRFNINSYEKHLSEKGFSILAPFSYCTQLLTVPTPENLASFLM